MQSSRSMLCERIAKKDNINSVFIDKLNHEMEQSKYVIYKAFAQKEADGEEFSVEQFGDLTI